MTIAWSSPAIARIVELIRTRTGLVFSEPRRVEVEGTIRRAMARRGIDSADRFTELVAAHTAVREELVAELTIGETYFRRDGAQFDLLERRLLPQLLAERAADRRLRIWSAGCASGEEPYSIVMLFDELNALDRAEVIGTDISRPRLADAQRGIYSRWSLRGVPDAVIERYFTPRGRYHELAPRVRQHVDFRYLNLAEDSFPSLSTGIWGMDLILCRNVLIYFDAQTVRRVARRLIDSLSESGWLVLGASDPTLGEMIECDVVLTDAGLLYRRVGAAGPRDLRTHEDVLEPPSLPYRVAETAHTDPPASLPALAGAGDESAAAGAVAQPAGLPRAGAAAAALNGAPGADDGESEVLRAWSARDYDAVRQHAGRLAARGPLSEAVWIAWLRSLANQGCLDEAGERVVRALDEYAASAELLYIHAVLQLQAGRARDAAAAARRALYLDRTLIVAHLTLADAAQRLGDPAAARRSLRNAAAQLTGLSRDAIVPASDGETAGRLAEFVRVQLDLQDVAPQEV